MNVENASYASSNGNGNFVSSPDSPNYYHNGGNQLLSQQQQPYGMVDQQQHHHQQQQQHMPYPMSPSPSSLFRLGSGHVNAGQGPLLHSENHHEEQTDTSQVYAGISSPALARALSTLSADKNRRPRSEKKPIPDDQKDDKYYERRRRNNEAAKKSRDARKAREDELAIRASYLEKDNSILKVQVHSMREEAMKLRELWVAKCQGLASVRQMTQQNVQQGRSMQNPVLSQVQNSLGPQGRQS